MRIWSLHPKYLDARGLVALWRETLLAQNVLKGNTKGYKNHPQLDRFKAHPQPVDAIAGYLTGIWEEAAGRGYHFDKKKIGKKVSRKRIPVTSGQMRYEFKWLCEKLIKRDPQRFLEIRMVKKIQPHPLFYEIKGLVEKWEKVKVEKA